VVSNIYLLISWNTCSIDITFLLGIVDKFCGTIESMDTSVSSNHAQLVLH